MNTPQDDLPKVIKPGDKFYTDEFGEVVVSEVFCSTKIFNLAPAGEVIRIVVEVRDQSGDCWFLTKDSLLPSRE